MSGDDVRQPPSREESRGSRTRRRVVGVLLGVAAGLALGFVVLFIREIRQTRAPVHGEYGPAPSFALVSETGDSLSSASLAGKVWAADFMFTRCRGVCPVLAERFGALQRELADRKGWMLVSFTVDPAYDTSDVLRAYAREHGADPERWRFLTGDMADIRRVVVDGFHLGIESSNDPKEPVTHSTRIALVDAQGEIRGLYDSQDEAEMKALLSDARRLLPRAG
jgi:protein SCO1/2